MMHKKRNAMTRRREGAKRGMRMTQEAKETARERIAELVAKFQADDERRTYNEDRTRHYYILPLFQALGWDTTSPQEFTAEEQISKGYVDFGFYVKSIPVFYLETKAVREKLDKPKFIRQSINYAFLKGVTWAVLTDFEDLIVYNADWETKDPNQARFLRLNHADYAESGFDDLWLLSKEAMQARQIDKVAERYGKKRRKESVTESLFADLTDWRRRLFNEIRQMGTTLWAQDSQTVDNAVQKFFDRLIFIRTVEDRNIEAPRLRAIQRQAKKGDYFGELLKLFRELDKVYNSNLFAEHPLDTLEVYDPQLINEIIDGLYEQRGKFVQYDFNAITADVLGAVYEQYLGFKAFDPQAETDTSNRKTLKRKTQGIYYTPQYIVRYIVQATLGRVLADFKAQGKDPHTIRVVDPACGSGAFLIEAFDVLDRWFAEHEPDLPIAERRQRILQENLFGVDLDDQAIEVTRLNLMVRATHERKKLPLLTNIRHGNSLIADDDIAGEGLGFDWQKRFAGVFETGGFDVVIGNPPYVRQETLGAQFKDYAKEHYATYAGTADLYVYFMEKGASILRDGGRMGYIVPNKWMRTNYGKKLRAFLTQRIETLIDFGDLPVFKDATTYPLIVTLNATPPEQVEVSQAPHLPEGLETMTQILDGTFYHVGRETLGAEGWTLARPEAQAVLDKMRAVGVPLETYVDGAIYRGVLTGYNQAFVIDATTRQRLIRQDPKSADLIKPFLAGRDVKRYQQPESDKFLISIPDGWTKQQTDDDDKWAWLQATYPAIAQHFAPHIEAMQKRWDKGEYFWELRPCAYYEEFEKPKIMFP
jgi:type I restriction-modification system DNA methylase subunit